MHDEVRIKVHELRTNRTFIHHDSQRPDIDAENRDLHEAITAFVQRADDSLLRTMLFDLIPNLDAIAGASGLRCFRGLEYGRAIKSIPIGPNPNLDSEGRYHIRGGKALYVTDDVRSIPLEIGTSHYALQEYLLPLDQVRSADLSSENQHVPNVLARAFSVAESGLALFSGDSIEETLEQQGRSRRAYSQLLASFMSEAGWQGFRVPGVHGDSTLHYSNIVVLGDSVDQWERWAVGEWQECSV